MHQTERHERASDPLEANVRAVKREATSASGVASSSPSRYHRAKYLVDRCLACALLIVGLPTMLVTILIVRLTSRGPGIHRQVRVGLKGRTFTMYKLRTMRQDAEAGTGAIWAQRDDPRITRVGRVMRSMHLDELPQLFNVLKGEMALVGPRPERPEFTQILALKIPGYMHRHLVRPGITGLAQVNLPPDTDLNSVRRKLVLDLEYIQKGSLGLDVRLLVATLLRLFGIRHGIGVWVLRLRRTPGLGSSTSLAQANPQSTSRGNVVEQTFR